MSLYDQIVQEVCEQFFECVECASWVDHMSECMHLSIGGLRFSITRAWTESEYDFLSQLVSRVRDTVAAISDGFGWMCGIWDAQWAMGHGSLPPGVEVLGW